MSNHLGSLKISGGILSIYCLSLVVMPTAHAQTNISNATGTTSYSSGFVSNGRSGAGAGQGAGGKSAETIAANTQAAIKAAQGFQTRLDTAQTTFTQASALVSQLSSTPSTPSTPTAQPGAVRFSVRSGGVLGESLANCGCKNPDVAVAPTKPDDNSAALAAAKEAEAKAATELAEAQAQARQFLAANKANTAAASTDNSTPSPLW
jgi:hypothetical protein